MASWSHTRQALPNAGRQEREAEAVGQLQSIQQNVRGREESWLIPIKNCHSHKPIKHWKEGGGTMLLWRVMILSFRQIITGDGGIPTCTQTGIALTLNLRRKLGLAMKFGSFSEQMWWLNNTRGKRKKEKCVTCGRTTFRGKEERTLRRQNRETKTKAM